MQLKNIHATEHPTIEKDLFILLQTCLATQMDKKPGASTFPLLVGGPGCGKSEIAREIAKFNNLFPLFAIMNRTPSPDVGGFLVPDLKKKTVEHLMTEKFINPEIPEGYDGVLVVLDEVGNAPPDTVASIQSMLNDWSAEGYPVADHVFFMLATNSTEDNCNANEISQAMQDRCAIWKMEPDVDAWLNWARANDVDYDIISFIGWKRDMLDRFDPNAEMGGQCTRRSWTKLSEMFKHSPDQSIDAKAMMARIKVGTAAGLEFGGWTKMKKELTPISEVLLNPNDAPVPTSNASACYAMCAELAYAFKKMDEVEQEDAEAAITYLRRMPESMAVFGFRMLETANKDFTKATSEFTRFKMDYKDLV